MIKSKTLFLFTLFSVCVFLVLVSADFSTAQGKGLKRGRKFATPAPVPKTGQTHSWSPGDDGDLQTGVEWPEPRFLDNGDGTVTDCLTDLMWIQSPNQLFLQHQDWEVALILCNELMFAGYDDWRLPNIRELLSLVDYGRCLPALPIGHLFFVDFSDFRNTYWSSTRREGLAWNVNFDFGRVNFGTSSALLWPVRGGNKSINIHF